MDVRVGLLFVLVLGICWACDGRHLLTSGDLSSSEATVVSDFSGKFFKQY